MKFKKDNELEILNEEQLDALPVEEEVSEPAIETVEASVVSNGVVITAMLNIRSGPGMDYVPLGTLYKGDKVEYTVENDEWLKLENRVGFVKREFIQ